MLKYEYSNWVYDETLKPFLTKLFQILKVQTNESEFEIIFYKIKLLSDENEEYSFSIDKNNELFIKFSRDIEGGILSFTIQYNKDYTKELDILTTKFSY